MKKQTILSTFLLTLLTLTVSSQVYASEVTGNLSSSGVTSGQTQGGGSSSGSEVTGTLATAQVTGTNQITGTVTGGSSGGGGGSSSGGGGGGGGGGTGGSTNTGGGMVLGASTVNTPAVQPTSGISYTYTPSVVRTPSRVSTVIPKSSALAVAPTQQEPTVLGVANETLPKSISSVDVSGATTGFSAMTWFWSIFLLLLLILAMVYAYVRSTKEDNMRR